MKPPYLPKITNFILSKIEYIVLLTTILVCATFYILNFYSYITLAISAAIGSLIFIKFNKDYINYNKLFTSNDLNYKLFNIRLLTSVVFFVFFSMSLLELLNGFYTKTILYYIFISLAAGAIATEIIFVKTEKQGLFNLLKSFLLTLNITLSNQILYPMGIGLPDLSFHLNGSVIPILNSGYVPETVYQYFPGHHILVVANILMCNSDPKMTYLYLGGFVISLGLVFVFLIGKKFVNLHFGLVAALVYTCLDYLLMYGSHPVHQSYNYFLSIVVFITILYTIRNRTPEFVILYIITITSMIFTHHLSAMIVLILLISIVTVEYISNKHSSRPNTNYLNLTKLFTVILFGQWIYYSNMIGNFAGIIVAYKDAFMNSSQNIMTQTAYDQIAIQTIVINSLGSAILILLSVIGFLSIVRKMSFLDRITITSSVIITFLLGIGIIFHQVALLPDRLYPFLQLFGLVFLASYGIIWALHKSSFYKHKLKYIPIIFVIICLSFFSCSSTIAGFETSPFVGDEMAYYKLYETPHEAISKDWILKHANKESNVQLNLPVTDTGDFDIEKNSISVFNKFYVMTGFSKGIGGHMGQHKFIRIQNAELKKVKAHDRYYNNGMINVFYNP
jgi:hypothetical protein